MRLDVHDLHRILALAEHGTFRQAARALGVSQPALSRSLQSIERALGARLFDRGGPGGLRATDLGRVLLDRGRDLVLEHDELLRELRLMQGLASGRITVAAAFFPASVSVHRAIGRLLRRHPGIEAHVAVATWRTCTEQVLAREADVAVADLRMAERDPGLEVEPLARHPFVFVCRPGHPILEAEAVTAEILFSFPWAATRAPEAMARHFPAPPYAAGRVDAATGEFIPAVVTVDAASSHEIVCDSDCLGVAVPSRLTGRPLAYGLVELPYEAPWARLDYGFITRRGRSASPATEAFKREVRAIEAGLSERSGSSQHIAAGGPQAVIGR